MKTSIYFEKNFKELWGPRGGSFFKKKQFFLHTVGALKKYFWKKRKRVFLRRRHKNYNFQLFFHRFWKFILCYLVRREKKIRIIFFLKKISNRTLGMVFFEKCWSAWKTRANMLNTEVLAQIKKWQNLCSRYS